MTNRRADLIAALEASLGDPRGGLPEDVFQFVGRITPLVNVDLLIQDDRGRTLLTWRDDQAFGRGWHVPGSVIRYQETAAVRIQACARDELGADVTFAAAPIAVMETILDQRDRAHAVSLLYRCALLGPPDPARQAAGDAATRGQWRWHATPPPDLLALQRDYARFF